MIRDIEPLAHAVAQLDSADPAERLTAVHAIAALTEEHVGEGREAVLDHLRAYLRRPPGPTSDQPARDAAARYLNGP
ncbi:hypothetical protein [Amycolatopsis samaneae]|uniref:HEAT repeat-containing protein n=1 Tax=Amycolatopsis samaneae TaxID=664691 RepID=A0ABW5GGP0_9PSEU